MPSKGRDRTAVRGADRQRGAAHPLHHVLAVEHRPAPERPAQRLPRQGVEAERDAVAYGEQWLQVYRHGASRDRHVLAHHGEDDAGAGDGPEALERQPGGGAQAGVRFPGLAEAVELRSDPVAVAPAFDGADPDQLVEQPVGTLPLGTPQASASSVTPASSPFLRRASSSANAPSSTPRPRSAPGAAASVTSPVLRAVPVSMRAPEYVRPGRGAPMAQTAGTRPTMPRAGRSGERARTRRRVVSLVSCRRVVPSGSCHVTVGSVGDQDLSTRHIPPGVGDPAGPPPVPKLCVHEPAPAPAPRPWIRRRFGYGPAVLAAALVLAAPPPSPPRRPRTHRAPRRQHHAPAGTPAASRWIHAARAPLTVFAHRGASSAAREHPGLRGGGPSWRDDVDRERRPAQQGRRAVHPPRHDGRPDDRRHGRAPLPDLRAGGRPGRRLLVRPVLRRRARADAGRPVGGPADARRQPAPGDQGPAFRGRGGPDRA
ncbi:hypothetical protein STANM309S_05104 [Streptomyces tanashiensis]